MDLNSKTTSEIEDAQEKEYLKRIEAILFISGRLLSMQEIVSYSDLNPIIIRELIEKLKEKYDKNDSAIQIIEKNDSWKMDVKNEYTHLVNRLAGGTTEFSRAEMETLAIIAYKQPIKQSVVIKIRSNKAYEDIAKFVSLGLVKKRKIGHTYELSLGDEFYNYFNIDESNPGSFLRKPEEVE